MKLIINHDHDNILNIYNYIFNPDEENKMFHIVLDRDENWEKNYNILSQLLHTEIVSIQIIYGNEIEYIKNFNFTKGFLTNIRDQISHDGQVKYLSTIEFFSIIES